MIVDSPVLPARRLAAPDAARGSSTDGWRLAAPDAARGPSTDGQGLALRRPGGRTEQFGVAGMVAPLRRLAMRRPGPATLEADPSLWHYAGPLDADRLTRQYGAFAECVAESGARIEWIPPADDGLADSIFVFDPSFMTPWGAILLRPGKALRRPEVALHREFYHRLGAPVIGSVERPGTVEGGDLMWLDERTLVAGRSFRTTRAGIEQLEHILAPRGVRIRAFDLPMWRGSMACLHLLSVISPLDRDLALVYPQLLPVALGQLLRERGVRCLEADDQEFQASGGLSLNVLATGPRRCIAVGGFPQTVRLMRGAGCEVTSFDADALCIPCEGGPTCLTLPLWRR